MMAAPPLPKVSVCIPVLNGEARLGACLASIRALDYPQDRIEIVIADGGSTDRTREIAASFGARIVDNPGKTVSAGRNVSFAAATGDYIASTDDDCEVPRDWLARAIGCFDAPDVAAVGGLSLLPETSGAWASAANHVFRLASRSGYSVQADHMPEGDVEDLPGCNVIYRAGDWREIGLFDEGLVTAEDVDLHLRLRGAGKRLRAAEDLFVWHHKRPTVRGLFRQLRRYAEGRVQLGRKWPDALRAGHKALGWAAPVLFLAGLAGLVLFPWLTVSAALVGWLALSGVALAGGERVSSALLVPAAALVVVAGWSWGYLKETFRPMPSAYGR